ncbi:TolC family protein [Pseudaquabacterium pictum]|uniref:Copper resistance-related lipoprotein n=1 Tax=Pseudaquabacterium pictum TaxID=2315236 RepID=A0A480AVQ2_9BURK|nr:TolC family protein [Rubrivivax pictus]GCL65584.1 copper resistance-related lipoprotein [Rubrivivax pictus]
MLASAAVLGGCASFTPDGGFATVEKTTKDRLGKDVQWARSDADQDSISKRVDELLSKPLTVDAAVQVALLNNRGLQADFQELGITEAEVVQAGRLPNPGFSFGRMSQGDEREIERGLHFNLARLVAMPLIGRMEARRFEQVQARVSMNVLSLAADTRKAYFTALAAEETVRYMRQVKQAADASAELARRMEQVGNFNKLQRAREQSFYANAALQLARAEQAQRSTRERLVRLLGLWGAQTQFALPERLPDLPPSPLELPDVEQVALAQRLDVQGARQAAEMTASNLGLTRTTRFVNVLELGLARNSSNEAPTQRGWEIGFELPLFDWGGARVARAEAIYMQTLHRAAETAINARSEVREAYTGYRSAYDIARHHRDELVPLNQRIAEENVLRYNGMFIGVFELLADARTQIASVNASIEALRDFWIAQADLDMALIGKPSLSAAAGPAMAAEAAGPGH